MPAPDFATERLGGGRLSLAELRGREVLLKFYRFAECPICNLHLRGFVMRHEEVAATPTADTGLTTVVVFHSPLGPIARQHEHELPFVVLADPEKRIFRAYGVEESWRGMFSGRVARDYARATAAGYFSRPLGHDGGIKAHPADFLIDGEGIIRFAHYGRSYADSLGVDEILSLAGELGIGTPTPAPAEVAAAGARSAEMTAVGRPYTAGSWDVHACREEEFIAAWTELSTWSLEQMPGAESFVLIRHRAEPQRFLSFGAWSDADEVAAWRSSEGFRERLGRCRALCEQFEGHDYEVAAAPQRR